MDSLPRRVWPFGQLVRPCGATGSPAEGSVSSDGHCRHGWWWCTRLLSMLAEIVERGDSGGDSGGERELLCRAAARAAECMLWPGRRSVFSRGLLLGEAKYRTSSRTKYFS